MESKHLIGETITDVEKLSVDWKRDGSFVSDVLRVRTKNAQGQCNLFYLFAKPDEKHSKLITVSSLNQFFTEFSGVSEFQPLEALED